MAEVDDRTEAAPAEQAGEPPEAGDRPVAVERGSRGVLIRLAGPDTATRLRRAALLVITGLAALSYSWALDRDPLEPYYEAAVRSMSASWHDFVFGSFDPAGTVTLDKLPGAFWLQALAVRAFGFHTWSMVLPQAVEGALTVLVLYRATRRLAGPTAGIVAAFVLALSPATVALDRGNVSDSLLILLLVAAADAVSGAIAAGSQRRLVLAGVFVGLAFQAKMIEAWMVLPALGLAYLLDAPGSILRRLRQLAVAGAVVGLVSLSWMTAVELVPASSRPYVDGSQHNSTYEQVFVYNGFGRFGDSTPLQLLAGQSLGIASVLHVPAAEPNRLLRGDLGRDTGWLLPTALVVAFWGVLARRRRPRGDPMRASFVLWGLWLLTLGAVFSAITTINAYYTAALTPAVAALLGAGVTAARQVQGSRRALTIGVAVLVAGATAYEAWLLPASGTHLASWLAPVTIAVGVAALVVVLATALLPPARRTDPQLGAALVAALLAGCLAPALASIELAANAEGAFDTPFEPAREASAIDLLFVTTPASVALTIPGLERVQRGAPWLLATETAALASVFIDESGKEVLPIGGFTGTIPSPTVQQLQADIAAGRFHLVLAATSSDPRIEWIATHCLDVGNAVGNLHNYYCLRPDAG